MSAIPVVLRNLLENLAERSEIERYLDQHSRVGPMSCATVKVGGGVLRDDLDEVASSLAFLHGLGLLPVVLHGAGSPLDLAAEGAALETERIDGMRVMSTAILHLASSTRPTSVTYRMIGRMCIAAGPGVPMRTGDTRIRPDRNTARCSRSIARSSTDPSGRRDPSIGDE